MSTDDRDRPDRLAELEAERALLLDQIAARAQRYADTAERRRQLADLADRAEARLRECK